MKAANDAIGVSPKLRGALEEVDGEQKNEAEDMSEEEMNGELKATTEEPKESNETVIPNVVAKPVAT